MKKLFLLIVVLFVVLNVFSQEINQRLELSGPRLGFTAFGPGDQIETLKKNDIVPFVTQFGWQFEQRFFQSNSGTEGLVETVLLLGGLEQGVLLPSASLLFGMRNAKGVEFGVGPNVSMSGFALAFSAGVTIKTENANFPINFAIVPSKEGARFSLLFGFTAPTPGS